ncbi:hypothetical protein GCM10023063_22250 [Arthrobacter methylotrophus]|uniref:Recombinase family protein n=1 Tax=Arthrobacter methylotrophus TaxID=121291 RepID=A0ABV5UVT8_9MICC
MIGFLIGYVRVSTSAQDLTAQKNALVALGVTPENTFTDQGLTRRQPRPVGTQGSAGRLPVGDTLVVTKLDRLARSLAMQRTSLTNSPGAESS